MECKKVFAPREVSEITEYDRGTIRSIARLFEVHNPHFSIKTNKGRLYDQRALTAIIAFKTYTLVFGREIAVKMSLNNVYGVNIEN